MKLPGQQRLAVQSLGRQDSSLEMRIAQSKVGLTDAVTQSVASVTTAVNREIVEPAYQREAVAQYAKAESDRATILTAAEAKINNPTGVVPIDDIPTWVDYREFDDDGDGGITRREVVPTHEIADEWYRGEMKRSQKSVMTEMTNAQAMRKMKADYGAAYLNNYAGVLLQAQKRKQAAELADMDMAVERFVEGGDTAKAETLILGGMKTGVIGPKEGTERLMAIPGDVEAYRVSRLIHTSTTTELDGLESYIYRDYNTDENGEIIIGDDGLPESNPMSFDQRKTAINELDSRRKSLGTAGTAAKDESSAEQLNADLIELQGLDDPLDEMQLTEKGYALNNTDHKTLIVANRALHATKSDRTDPRTLAEFQLAINDLATHDPDQTIQARRGALMNTINNALDTEELTADDAWKLIERINTTEERTFQTPDMDMAVDQIYVTLTRGSKNNLGLSKDSEAALNAADAELALFNAARTAGPSFDALGWWGANKWKYQTKNQATKRSSLNKLRAKGRYVYIEDADGFRTLDEEATMVKFTDMRRAGDLTRAQLAQEIEIVEGLAADLRESVAVEKERIRREKTGAK